MKKIYFFVLLLCAALSTQAQTVLTIQGANATNPFYVQSGAVVYIQGGISIDDQGSPSGGSNYLLNNGTIELVSGGTPNLSGFTNNVPGLKIYSTGQTTGLVIFGATSETQTVGGGGTVEFLNLTTNNTSSPTLNLLENISVDGAFTLGGTTCNINSNTLTLNGTFVSSGTLTGSSTSNLSITGSGNLGSALTFASGAQALQNFSLNRTNSSGQTILLGSNLVVSGTLTLTNGLLTLGSNNITLSSGAALAGSPYSSSNMAVTNGSGQFIWGLPVISSSASYTFPVGDATPNYTPVSLTFASNSVAGNLGVNVVNSTETNMNTPTTPSAYFHRYWTFGNNTLTGNYSYSGTFGYLAAAYPTGDLTGSQSNIQLSAWTGSAWQAYYGSAASSGTLSLTETLNQTTAALTGDFTGRTGTPAAYAVTGGNNCYSTTVGVSNSQADVSYQLYANGVPTGIPIVPSSSGNAISFGAQTVATATTYTVVATDGNGNTMAMTGSASVYPTPVPTTNNTGPVCPYNLVSISSGPNGFTAYSWSGPNSYSSTSQNPAAFVSGGNEGIYTVTVTDGNNCTASKTTTVTSLPLPVVTVSPSDAICTGQITVPLSASATSGGGGPYSYTWAPNTALNTTNGSSVTASISLLTFYTVTGVGANGCTAISNVVPVATVPVGGTVTPTATVICSGGTTTLTSSGAAGHDYQWQISPDNVNWTNIGGATGLTYITASETAKQYYRQLANSNACYDIASTTGIVDISVTPTVTITNVTSTTAIVTWTPYGSGQYNISWSGNAGSGSASALTSNIFVVGQSPTTPLIPNEDLLVTITPATIPACGGVNAASMGTHTLCGSPTVTNVSPTAFHGFVVDWDAVTGATAYRVYYRDLSNSTSWSFVDVTGGATSVTITANAATYAVYVAAKDCPSTGNIGDASTPVNYVTTNPVPSCGPPPTVSTVSNCPNQITVSISGSGPPYNLILRRISPSLTAGVSYPISTSAVNVTIGTQYAGSTWEIFATQVCGPGSISAASNISDVTVKPACPVVNNLVLSHPTCNGFTASWNTSDCAGLGISKYELLIKRSNELNYAGYPVSSQLNYETVTWEPDNTTYDVVVMAVACNDASSGYSNEQTISSLNCGREGVAEDANSNATGNTKESVTVYPNPAQGQFYLDIGRTDMSEAGVKIELLNELGQVVETSISQISGGHLSQLINTPEGLATGIYFVRTSVGGNVYVNRIMITRE